MSHETAPFTLNLTFETLMDQALQGKIPAIYYSAHTLWWTHDPKDVEAATKTGTKKQELDHASFMDDPHIPADVKRQQDSLWRKIKTSSIPKDPIGGPLMMITKKESVIDWFKTAQRRPEHFGRWGLQAFMRAHHQNCNGHVDRTWAFYNKEWKPLN